MKSRGVEGGAGRVESSADFSVFVRGHARTLLRTAWLLTGDWAAAEDLVQSALTDTWQHWATLRRPDAAGLYVRTVMTRTFLRWRKRKWLHEIPTADPGRDQPAPDETDAAIFRSSMAEAMAALSPKQRAVVALRYLADLSEAETAAVLGCSVGAVKSHSARALARLRAAPGLLEALRSVAS